MKYDPVNQILFGQWNNSKVVSCISSLGVSGRVTVKRRVGSQKIYLEIGESLKRYTHDNLVGGVDNVDKDKKIGGAFTKKAMFKKWYQMGIRGLFDFMVVHDEWHGLCQLPKIVQFVTSNRRIENSGCFLPNNYSLHTMNMQS